MSKPRPRIQARILLILVWTSVVWALLVVQGSTRAEEGLAAFDRLLVTVENLPQAEQDRAVAEFLATHGGATPVVEAVSPSAPAGRTLETLFLVRPADVPTGEVRTPRILADFNRFGEAGDGGMTAIADSGWWYLRRSFESAARIEYLLDLQAPWEEDRAADEIYDRARLDPRNPRKVASWVREHSEVRMPAYRPPVEYAAAPPARRGRLQSHTLDSPTLGPRTVHVYLPPGYDRDTERRYPTVYFHDGAAYRQTVGVPHILDHRITVAEGQERLPPVIAILMDHGPNPGDRRREYAASAEHRRYVADELVPWVDGRYRTRPEAGSRLLVGGSRGALAATDLALHRPDVFGAVVAMAPAVAPILVEDLVNAGRRSFELHGVRARFLVIVDTYDLRWREDGEALATALGTAGWPVIREHQPENHSLTSWRSVIGPGLVALSGSETRDAP